MLEEILANSSGCLKISVWWYNNSEVNLVGHINFISIIIICIFLMPVIAGVLSPLSKGSIRHSFLFIINCLNFIVSAVLAAMLVKVLFSDAGNGFQKFVNKAIPAVGELIYQYRHDIVAYLIAMFVFTAVIFFLLGLVTLPFCRHVVFPLADKLSAKLDSVHPNVKRTFSGLWQLPKALCTVLVFSLLLSFYANFINNPTAGEYINASKAYQAIHKTMLTPILSANLVKKAPVIIGDAFRKAAEDYTPANADSTTAPNYWNLPAIKYFNGVTVDEAIQSNTEIDNAAKLIVGNEKDDVKKAYLLYKWVSSNIRYDNAKAAIIMDNPSHVDSGSIVTFKDKMGVCFDYSCLYVSMCRATGLKVRLISGLGYNGDEWGEHVWNQVYDPKEKRWINVDTTFGASGYDYFDNPGFSANHRYEVVQAEW